MALQQQCTAVGREITLYGKTDCLDSTEIVRVRGENIIQVEYHAKCGFFNFHVFSAKNKNKCWEKNVSLTEIALHICIFDVSAHTQKPGFFCIAPFCHMSHLV